mmetsp:Transcript_110657/g.352391  ORF Transcript_110657/g.352391 Transcript_110657/m.352391 type:complete len:574 (+) Transcript_110657:967-2688(+)
MRRLYCSGLDLSRSLALRSKNCEICVRKRKSMLFSSKLTVTKIVCLRKLSTKARPDPSRRVLSRSCSTSRVVLLKRPLAIAMPASSDRRHELKFRDLRDCEPKLSTPPSAAAAVALNSLPRRHRDSKELLKGKTFASSTVPAWPMRHDDKLRCFSPRFKGRAPTRDFTLPRWSHWSRTRRSNRSLTCKASSMRPTPSTLPPLLDRFKTRTFGTLTVRSMVACTRSKCALIVAKASSRSADCWFASTSGFSSRMELRATCKFSRYFAAAASLASLAVVWCLVSRSLASNMRAGGGNVPTGRAPGSMGGAPRASAIAIRPSSPILLSDMLSSSMPLGSSASATAAAPRGPRSQPARSRKTRVEFTTRPLAKPSTPSAPKLVPCKQSRASTGFWIINFSSPNALYLDMWFRRLPLLEERSSEVTERFTSNASKMAFMPWWLMSLAARSMCTSVWWSGRACATVAAPTSPRALFERFSEVKRSFRARARQTPLAHSGPALLSLRLNHSELQCVCIHSANLLCRSKFSTMCWSRHLPARMAPKTTPGTPTSEATSMGGWCGPSPEQSHCGDMRPSSWA